MKLILEITVPKYLQPQHVLVEKYVFVLNIFINN